MNEFLVKLIIRFVVPVLLTLVCGFVMYLFVGVVGRAVKTPHFFTNEMGCPDCHCRVIVDWVNSPRPYVKCANCNVMMIQHIRMS